ncbi:hypothetical protein KQY27_07795 [Methanobrevibacter sp. TMH8]|uniref:hypothetical protein n=1 Tax=Methanobrevibacter sp. TMH8 TaxID=2848611 RepID=UPI001CCD2BC0|nr:hypothetical protein [Methanobrevibacter sp. TMH8]MBZ9571447.1 hypothetical protein [Methanobrevibacter sp. TMH8]
MLSMNVFKKVKNFGKNKNCVEFETMTLGKLLTKDFINNFTEFSDFDQMIDVSGIKTINNSFTDVFISREWDEFVNYTTDFSGWKEMIERAVENYISNE